jgi:hypothetical protein
MNDLIKCLSFRNSNHSYTAPMELAAQVPGLMATYHGNITSIKNDVMAVIGPDSPCVKCFGQIVEAFKGGKSN